jgi:hypothetical protein
MALGRVQSTSGDIISPCMSKATKQCIQCRKEFVRYLSRRNIVAGRGRFCTQACSTAFRLALPPEKQPQWKGGKPTWSCLTCTKPFESWRRKDAGPRSFCSIKCLGVENGRRRLGVPRPSAVRLQLSRAFKGERSHFWRGGLTKTNALIRESTEYTQWREAVLKRDNYTCVDCGSRKRLQADHIKQFAFYPSLRFELSNGRTLCIECHRKTPTWGNNRSPHLHEAA